MNAYIVDGVRTPIGKFAGSLSSIRTDDLAAHVLKSLLERNGALNSAAIEDVILGCANQAGEDNRNVARMALLLAGLPVTVPGYTVNRLCASGLCAVVDAARAISSGEGDVFVAGGVEHMTRAPFVMAKAEQAFSRDAQIFDTSLGWRFVNPKMKEVYGIDSMGQTAENLAEKYVISRDAQDEFALNSQSKAEQAIKAGRFEREITGLSIPAKKGDVIKFSQDEFPRFGSTREALAKLKPAFRTDGKGTVTAGNASGINDGAAALLIVSEAALKKFNLKPLARVLSSGTSGVEPRIMGIGPVRASQIALERAGLSLDQMGVIEINEAFAAQVLACTKEMQIEADDHRLNPNGGAIALGHPLGMSGARLTLTAVHELQEKNERYALVTMCVGVGQGMAAILERV